VAIGLASPTRDTERLARLLRERLDSVALERPVEEIGLEAGDFEPLAGYSAGMFGDARAESGDWAQLLERLELRLGRGAVHGLALYPDHRPELAWRRVEPGEWEPREFRQPGARPLWLLESPRRLRDGEFTLLAGPERIEAGWWDGDEAKRDYFIAQWENALAWVYREADEWFLHGLFA
jgi:protein ImuB